MLDPKIIERIRYLEIKASRLVTDALSGEYLSAFRGHGMEFEKVREYVHGDDVRRIDWNVTARMNAPYVKVFREERQMTVMLLVDMSSSMGFSSVGKTKKEIAAELAAIIGFLATKNQDKVGLMIFTDQVESYIPPSKGKAHIWRLIRSVLTFEPHGKKTSLGVALQNMCKSLHRQALCFVISDFFNIDHVVPMSTAAYTHELVLIKVEDPLDHKLPQIGLIQLQDPESGEVMVVDTSSKNVAELWENRRKSQDEKFWKQARRNKISGFTLSTEEEVLERLERYLRNRR